MYIAPPPSESKIFKTYLHIILILALFIIAKKWMQLKQLQLDQWVNKMELINIVEIICFKKKEALIFLSPTITWIHFEDIMPCVMYVFALMRF